MLIRSEIWVVRRDISRVSPSRCFFRVLLRDGGQQRRVRGPEAASSESVSFFAHCLDRNRSRLLRSPRPCLVRSGVRRNTGKTWCPSVKGRVARTYALILRIATVYLLPAGGSHQRENPLSPSVQPVRAVALCCQCRYSVDVPGAQAGKRSRVGQWLSPHQVISGRAPG